MGDFHQNGIITTLHNISRRPTEEIESELVEYVQRRPLALVLPSLYSELSRAALGTIIDELSKVEFVSEIVIGLDQASEDEYRHAIDFFSTLKDSQKLFRSTSRSQRKPCTSKNPTSRLHNLTSRKRHN